MDALSPELNDRARKTRAVLFRGVRSVGQNVIAAQLGISDGTFSDWLAKYGDRVALLLTAAGLKAVPADAVCLDPGKLAFLKRLAIERLQRADEADTVLDWGDV